MIACVFFILLLLILFADTLDNKLSTELSSIPCTESFMDTRLYIQDKPRQEWDNLSTIYFVTPTYPRREQVPELTRLAYTLQHVPRLHWIVANDFSACNPYLDTLLYKFGELSLLTCNLNIISGILI